MKEAISILSIESNSIVFISPILELLHAGHALREDITSFSLVRSICHPNFNILNR